MSAIRFTNSMFIMSKRDYLDILIAPSVKRCKSGTDVATLATKRERRFLILPRNMLIDYTGCLNLSDNLPKFVSSRFAFLRPKVDRTGYLLINGELTSAPQFKLVRIDELLTYDIEKVSL